MYIIPFSSFKIKANSITSPQLVSEFFLKRMKSIQLPQRQIVFNIFLQRSN